jgi:hypothetical protein
MKDRDIGEFLQKLTELSREYMIGIHGGAELFIMIPEDTQYSYGLLSDSDWDELCWK